MIVLVLTAIGVATALLTPTRVRRLADLRLVGLWLVWTALLVQLVVFEIIGQHVPMWSSNALHLLSYALCVAFLWRNRAIPGAMDHRRRDGVQPDRDLRQRRHDARQRRCLGACWSPGVRP